MVDGRDGGRDVRDGDGGGDGGGESFHESVEDSKNRLLPSPSTLRWTLLLIGL